MAMHVVIPKRLLMDLTINPTTKMLYAVLSSRADDSGLATLDYRILANIVAYDNGTGVQTLTEDMIKKCLDILEDKEYISIKDGKANINPSVTVIKEVRTKTTEISEEAEEVLHYLFEKRIEKGYSVRQSKGKDHLKIIQWRLNKGATVEEMKQVIDAKMVDKFFQENTHYLLPKTLFKNKYDDYLAQVTVTEEAIHIEENEEIVGTL